MTLRRLGDVLLKIDEFSFGAGIYLPDVARYEADTPCYVEEFSAHDACLDCGFKNWLNVAVVSDTCENVLEKTAASLITAFNDDCCEGKWLRKMMNYLNPDSVVPS